MTTGGGELAGQGPALENERSSHVGRPGPGSRTRVSILSRGSSLCWDSCPPVELSLFLHKDDLGVDVSHLRYRICIKGRKMQTQLGCDGALGR